MKRYFPILVLLLLAPGFPACSEQSTSGPLFEDVTELSGLEFTHQSGSDSALALPSILGSGVALFDVDNDNDLDVYLVQGGGAADTPDEIWLNDSEGDRLRFSRMPHQTALQSSSAGVGVAIGDANVDGRLDVLITTVGRNRTAAEYRKRIFDLLVGGTAT